MPAPVLLRKDVGGVYIDQSCLIGRFNAELKAASVLITASDGRQEVLKRRTRKLILWKAGSP